MVWSDEKMSVGVKVFDEQHKKLIAMINDLDDAMSKGKGNTVLSGLFSKLVAYTADHFKAEEKLLTQHSYPMLADHLVEHEKLTKQALEYKANFESGKLTVSVQLINFLKDWLQKHILNTDKKYGPFLNEHGVK